MEGAIAANIVAVYKMPESASKKRRELMASGIMKPCKKPDADNVAKIVLDSLNGIAYKDDSQVVYLSVQKNSEKIRALLLNCVRLKVRNNKWSISNFLRES